MERLKEGQRKTLLPHHFYDFVLTREITGDKHIVEAINSHSGLIAEGIASSEYKIRIPEEDPAREWFGEWIDYKFDVYGRSWASGIRQNRSNFESFFIGESDEKIFISLDPDVICNTCFVGVHCRNADRERKLGRSIDNYYLESLFSWYSLSQELDSTGLDNKQIRKLKIARELKEFFVKVKRFGEIKNDVSFEFVGDRVTAFGITRKTLIKNLDLIKFYFFPPLDYVEWISKDKNLLSKNREKLDILGEKRLGEMLDIISVITTFPK